jgi:hypothetical protein
VPYRKGGARAQRSALRAQTEANVQEVELGGVEEEYCDGAVTTLHQYPVSKAVRRHGEQSHAHTDKHTNLRNQAIRVREV